jgi:hypothetical protein
LTVSCVYLFHHNRIIIFNWSPYEDLNLDRLLPKQPCYQITLYGETWCRRKDLNPRPTHYECVALPSELHRHKTKNPNLLRTGVCVVETFTKFYAQTLSTQVFLGHVNFVGVYNILDISFI